MTLTVPDVNYNSAIVERDELKDKIKRVVANNSTTDTIELDTINESFRERSTTNSGTNNITTTVVF